MIILEMFHGRISLNLMLLLLQLILLVGQARINIVFNVNIRSRLIHLHVFQLLELKRLKKTLHSSKKSLLFSYFNRINPP